MGFKKKTARTLKRIEARLARIEAALADHPSISFIDPPNTWVSSGGLDSYNNNSFARITLPEDLDQAARFLLMIPEDSICTDPDCEVCTP